MNLLTTKTLEHVVLCLHIFVCFCFLGLYRDVLSGGLFTWRSTPGGLFLCFFLCFMSSWLDQLSFRYQMVYAIYVIYDLEGSNDVNPQVRNLFHVGKIYLPFCLVH